MISRRKRLVSSSERTRKGSGRRSPSCRMMGTLPAWKCRSDAPCSATRRRKESKRAISAPRRLGGGPGRRRRRLRYRAGRLLRTRRLRAADGRRLRGGLFVEERLEVLLAHRLHVCVLGGDLPLLEEPHQVLVHQL